MFRSSISLAALTFALAAQPAFGQDVSRVEPAGQAAIEATVDAADAEPGSAAQAHHEEEQLVVTGVRRSEGDALGGISVLDKAELTREVRPSIGETLARQPGVSATSFGPAASAPVLRGLSGDRVRILTDGIGSLDVSSTSADHAVAINPLTAERIEVLRGPSALLFGSSAIGGVVNVIDSRIPRRVPEEVIHADGLLTYGSAANERSAIVVTEVKNMVIGMLVDRVSDILTIKGSEVQPAPEITTSFDKGFTDGIIAREGGMICFLNLAKMFHDQEAIAA